MTIATVEDVSKALGRPITDQAEIDRVQWWLDAAELMIVSRLGDITALDQAAVRYVEVEAVVAKMQNPDGYQSETIDDYTYRFGTESRRVTILDEWWDLLRPTGGSDAFSTRPGFEPDGYPYPWGVL